MSDGPILDHVLNRLHQGSYRIIIGDMPISYSETDAPARETINGNITSFICPGLHMKYATDPYYKGIVHIPIQEDNEYENKVLTVNMICDDRSENWWSLYRYMETLQSGQTGGFPVQDKSHRIYGNDGIYRNRLAYIPNIDIIAADGSYQRHATIRFKRCFPVDLSDVIHSFIEGEPVTFNVSFVYSNREVIREMPPSDKIIPPNHVAE